MGLVVSVYEGGGGRSGGVSPLLAPWGALRGRGELEGGKPSIQRGRSPPRTVVNV